MKHFLRIEFTKTTLQTESQNESFSWNLSVLIRTYQFKKNASHCSNFSVEAELGDVDEYDPENVESANPSVIMEIGEIETELEQLQIEVGIQPNVVSVGVGVSGIESVEREIQKRQR